MNTEGVPYIGTKDIGFDGKVLYQNGVAIPKKHLSLFKKAYSNSILMCIEGGSAGRKITLIDKTVCFGNKLCCITSYYEKIRYLFYYLQSPMFFEIFNQNKNGIIGGVSVNNLKNLFIVDFLSLFYRYFHLLFLNYILYIIYIIWLVF